MIIVILATLPVFGGLAALLSAIAEKAVSYYTMHPLPGTYALIFLSSRNRQLVIGKLGILQLKPGFYVYVGSAFGPGGLKARIAHHCRKAVRPHWHIDYLSSFLELNAIWHTYDSVHREHQWAKIIAITRGASVPLAGFGSSDCRCKAHLVFRNSRPSIRSFRRKIDASTENHGKVFVKKDIPLKSGAGKPSGDRQGCLNENK